MNSSEGCTALEVKLSYNEKESELLNDCMEHESSPHNPPWLWYARGITFVVLSPYDTFMLFW